MVFVFGKFRENMLCGRGPPTPSSLNHHGDEGHPLRLAISFRLVVVTFEVLIRCDCGGPVIDRVGDDSGMEPGNDNKVESCGQTLTPPWQVNVGRATGVSGLNA